jgi:hypothetical protein
MLNYGAAAQTYFGYNTENLSNAGFESTETVEIPAVDTSNMVSGSASGISFYGASLVFESKVAVRFYFKVTGSNGVDAVGERYSEMPSEKGEYFLVIGASHNGEYGDFDMYYVAKIINA